MGTIYFAQYPLLSLILWGNKNHILSIVLMYEVSAERSLLRAGVQPHVQADGRVELRGVELQWHIPPSLRLS